jgi:hypothetical protein
MMILDLSMHGGGSSRALTLFYAVENDSGIQGKEKWVWMKFK